MANVKDKRFGAFKGRPELIARHIEFPVVMNDEPDREAVVLLPASSIPRLIKRLSALHARANGTSAVMALLDDELKLDAEGPDRT